MQNGHSRSFKIISFSVTEEPLLNYIAQYNNCGLRCEGSEDMAGKKRKSPFSTPHSHLKPLASEPCEYPHKPYFTRNCDPWATFFVADSMGLSSLKFAVGSERHVCNATERKIAVQGQIWVIQGR